MQITCMQKEFIKTEIKNLVEYNDLYLLKTENLKNGFNLKDLKRN